MQKISVVRLIIVALAALCPWVINTAPAFATAEMHMVPVLAQPVARGEVIRDESVVMQEIKRSPAGFDYITDSAMLTGMAAKRPLRAGVPLRVTDIAPPQIIKKGDLITIAFEAPGLSLSIRGKALEDAILGQSIRVINTQTNRTFEGVATAPGYVLVSPPALPQTSRLEYSPPTAALSGQ